MGKIYDRFNDLIHKNEDQVKQNFLIPFLTEFLGYNHNEILPEEKFPARAVHSGVYKIGDTKGFTNKPDYIICINGDISSPKIIIDAKDPKENIDDHLPQIKSYTLSVGINLIVITNGVRLMVLDSNELLFNANNIGELDERFEQLYILLGRSNQATKNLKEIIESIDSKVALGVSDKEIADKEVGKRKIILSDFSKYLIAIHDANSRWYFPANFQGLNNIELSSFDPIYLHRFHLYTDEHNQDKKTEFSINQILFEFNSNNIKVIVGDTGIGKTTLLKYLTFLNAERCLNFKQTRIPIYIPLRNIGTHNSLENLIRKELESNFYNCQSVYNFLDNNKVVLFLDGYDEVLDNEIKELDQGIKSISQKCICIITTREKRIPEIRPAEVFKANNLNEERIEHIVEKQLGSNKYKFLHEIEIKRLKEESQNTLLLLLMISIFKQENELPSSLTGIADKIIQRIIEWEKNKNKSDSLSWDVKKHLFSELGFEIIKKDNPTLSFNEIKTIIAPIIQKYVEERIISNDTTVKDAIQSLSNNGIIIYKEEKLYFWHRIFLNYFGSYALANKIIGDNVKVEQYKTQINWENIIIGSSFFLNDSTNLINKLNDNIWIAASCLNEAKSVSNEVKIEILNQLIKKCSSQISEIRQRSLWHLRRMDREVIKETFWKLFNSSQFVDVKMVALEEIAKEKSNEAKELVIKNLKWKEYPGVLERGSISSVIHALSNFGDAELSIIIEIWNEEVDIWTSMECQKIFLRLIKEERITEEIKTKLIQFYFDNYKKEKQGRDKSREIAKVIIALNDESIIPDLIALFDTDDRDYPFYYRDSVEILSNYKSSKSINVIFENAISTLNTDVVRERCAEALVNSKGNVPLDHFLTLTKDSNENVKINGIEGLVRFPFESIKDTLFEFLNCNNRRLQNAAFKATDSNAIISEVLNDSRFPQHIYRPSLFTFLDIIRKYRLVEVISNLNFMLDELNKQTLDLHLYSEIINTFIVLGESQKATDIVNSFYKNGKLIFDDQYDLVKIINIVEYFEKDYATKVLLDIYDKVNPLIISGNGYIEDKFLNAIEKIGTDPLIEAVKSMLEELISKNERNSKNEEGENHFVDYERIFRTLTQVCTNKDEDWLLNTIERILKLKVSIYDINRAVECLALYGTEKSLGLIRKIAREYGNSNKNFILNSCLYSYESIIRNSGVQREITQEELLN